MRIYLAPEVINSFNSALEKLTGYERRQYAAELCEKFFDNSPRKMEKRLNVSRSMVELGLHECRTGCLLYTSPSPRDLSTSRMPSSA